MPGHPPALEFSPEDGSLSPLGVADRRQLVRYYDDYGHGEAQAAKGAVRPVPDVAK